MLILADLSGIQDYLFDVREIGGRQASALRFRSLYIQLITEAIGVRLLRAADLNEKQMIFCSAGKIALHMPDLSDDRLEAVHKEIHQIELWLLEQTHGRLRLSVAIHNGPGMPVQQYEVAGRKLAHAKARGWSYTAIHPNGRWQPDQLITPSRDEDREAKRDAELGRLAVRSTSRFLVIEEGNGSSVDVVGLRARFVPDQPTQGQTLYVRDMANMMRYVPSVDGHILEFIELAKESRGSAMLGVLKADADSMGAAISDCLKSANSLISLRDFSKRLETFFASDIDQLVRGNPRWSKLYTVFAGGDDLLMIGPWDIVLDFAGYVRRLFAEAFKQEGLTISAGIAIVKPQFPVRLGARQADDLLNLAKSYPALQSTQPKDQCATLGGLWKWSSHETILRAGKQLADWVDAGIVQRGWLHTLLELTLLRQGAIPDTPRHEQLLATARLAYHVQRNWKDRIARSWIEGILEQFDLSDSTSNPQALHLPAIIRYAMLATRSSGDNE